jgi:hypothetical protein
VHHDDLHAEVVEHPELLGQAGHGARVAHRRATDLDHEHLAPEHLEVRHGVLERRHFDSALTHVLHRSLLRSARSRA